MVEITGYGVSLPPNVHYVGPSPEYIKLQNQFKNVLHAHGYDAVEDIKDKKQAALVLGKIISRLDELVHDIKILQQAVLQLKD